MINTPVEIILYRDDIDDHYNPPDFDDSLISYDYSVAATQHAHPRQSFAEPVLPDQPSQRTVDVLERGSATLNVRNGVFDFVEPDGSGDGLRVRFRDSREDSKKDTFNEAMIDDEVVEMSLYSGKDSKKNLVVTTDSDDKEEEKDDDNDDVDDTIYYDAINHSHFPQSLNPSSSRLIQSPIYTSNKKRKSNKSLEKKICSTIQSFLESSQSYNPIKRTSPTRTIHQTETRPISLSTQPTHSPQANHPVHSSSVDAGSSSHLVKALKYPHEITLNSNIELSTIQESAIQEKSRWNFDTSNFSLGTKRFKKIGNIFIKNELYGLFEVTFKDGVIREQEIGFRVASEGYMTITEVTQGTRADFCELRIGDIIRKVRDITIIENNMEARRRLYEELVNYPSIVSLTIARKADKKKIGKLFENFYQIGNKVKKAFTRSKYSQKEIKCRLNIEEEEKREMMLLLNTKDPPQYFLFGEDDNEPPDIILKDSQYDDDRSKIRGRVPLSLVNSIRHTQASIEGNHETSEDVQTTIHSRRETYEHEDGQTIEQKDHTNQQPDDQKTPATSITFSLDKDMVDTSGYVTSNRNSCEVTNVGANNSPTFVSLSTRKGQERRKRRRCLMDNKENMATLSDSSLINNSSFCYNSKKKTFKQIAAANIDESDLNFSCNFCNFLPKTAANDRMATERNFIVQDRRASSDRETSTDHPPNISTNAPPPFRLFIHSTSSSQYPPSTDRLTSRSFDNSDDNRDAHINNNNNNNADSEFVEVTEKLNQDNRTFNITQKLVVTLHDLEFKFKCQIINLATEIRTFAYKHDLEKHFKELLRDVRELESLALQNCVSVQSWAKSLPNSDHLIRYCIHILKSYHLICFSYFDNLGINIRRIDTMISSRNLGLNRSKFEEMMKWPAEHLRETLRAISDFAEDPCTPLSEPLHDVIIKGLLLLNRPIPYRKKVKIPKAKLKNRRVQFVAGL